LLSGEPSLSLESSGGPLEDISAPDDPLEKTKPNNMWARSFVRLLREMVEVIRGGALQGEPATFRDGWQVQRVLDAIRGGRGVQLDLRPWNRPISQKDSGSKALSKARFTADYHSVRSIAFASPDTCSRWGA